MNVRDAAAGEAAVLAAIARECFGESAWNQRHFGALESPGLARWILVAETGAPGGARAAIAGYLVMQQTAESAEVESLAVRPQWRRQGVAAALLQQGLERARRRGAREAYLEVRASNTAAQSFYLRCGFVEFGRRERYYHQPDEAAALMRRVLKPLSL